MIGKIRVLICDDHTLFREGLKALLQNEAGLEVVGEAENGREAIEKLKQIPTDVVLMDISMPHLNGFEATQRIVQTHRNIHVLILTMYDEDDLIIRCLEAGASGYVLKDAPAKQLMYAIREARKGGKYLSPSVVNKVVSQYLQSSVRPKDTYDLLSAREREVLKMLAEGLSVKEVAYRLKLSVKTVEAHKYNLMRKLDVHDRTELVKYAIQKKLIRLSEPNDKENSMQAGIQQAEQKWHDELYASRPERDLVVPLSIRNRYLSPSRTPRFYLECLFNLVGDIANKRVLVFGCGDDNTTVLLALKGAEVWAFDISEEAVRLQEKMALANNVQDRIHLFVCAAEEFPFSPNSFDLIVGTAILHHIPDHLSQLPQQLVPALDRNGRALFVEPVILSPALGRVMALLPGHQDISPGERQLTEGDLGHFGKCFRVTPHYFCFLGRLDRFILNRPLEVAPAWQRMIVNGIHWVDSVILGLPFLNRLAGVAVLELSPLKQ